MKNAKFIAVTIILLLLVGGGSFYAGMKYQESKSPRGGSFQGDRARQFQQRFGQGARPVNGEIISKDDKSITVKMQDGSSKIVLLTDKTTINKSAEGSKSDIKVGEIVAVFGTENSDGSVTAQNVQLNPQFRGFMGSPGPSPNFSNITFR